MLNFKRVVMISLLAVAPTAALADQKACEDCARKVQVEYAACMKAKNDQVTCNKESQAAAKACAEGPCKK